MAGSKGSLLRGGAGVGERRRRDGGRQSHKNLGGFNFFGTAQNKRKQEVEVEGRGVGGGAVVPTKSERKREPSATYTVEKKSKGHFFFFFDRALK